MTALIKALYDLDKMSIKHEIESHPAWFSQASGFQAERMLRGKKIPYLYLLRAGETENDYYVTFTLPEGLVKHQPFVITITNEGWVCENGCAQGPYANASIEDVLHLVMHCEKGECIPFVNFKVQ